MIKNFLRQSHPWAEMTFHNWGKKERLAWVSVSGGKERREEVRQSRKECSLIYEARRGVQGLRGSSKEERKKKLYRQSHKIFLREETRPNSRRGEKICRVIPRRRRDPSFQIIKGGGRPPLNI